jgi:hypothetical protein
VPNSQPVIRIGFQLFRFPMIAISQSHHIPNRSCKGPRPPGVLGGNDSSEKRRAGYDVSMQIQRPCERQMPTSFSSSAPLHIPRAARLFRYRRRGRSPYPVLVVARHDRKRRYAPWPITLSLGLSKLLSPSSEPWMAILPISNALICFLSLNLRSPNARR